MTNRHCVPTKRSSIPGQVGFHWKTVALICALSMALPLVADQPHATQAAAAVNSDARIAALEQELRAAETAFAAAFAAGDMETFASFLDEHAVFMGGSTPLRGKLAIVERWTRLRGTGEAPFGWRPERVAVAAGGRFGLSTGPVSSPDGVWTSSFVSTWHKTSEGWRVMLDVGPRCPPRIPDSDSAD